MLCSASGTLARIRREAFIDLVQQLKFTERGDPIPAGKEPVTNKHVWYRF
jgi:hypothetical protein